MEKFDPVQPASNLPRANGPRGKEWFLALFFIVAAALTAWDWLGTPDRSVAAAPLVQHHPLAGAATAN
jgi:hypothetical protein